MYQESIYKIDNDELAWKVLIKHYANGRKICNCGNAYRKEDGGCFGGCTTNEILAKLDISSRILKELGIINFEDEEDFTTRELKKYGIIK